MKILKLAIAAAIAASGLAVSASAGGGVTASPRWRARGQARG